MRSLAIGCAIIALSASIVPGRAEDARIKQQWSAALDKCRADIPLQPGRAKDLVACQGRENVRYARRLAPRDVDLVQLATRRLMVAADDYDAGRLTAERLRLAAAEAEHALAQEAAARDARGAAQQQAASQALIWGGLNMMGQAVSPPHTQGPQAPLTTECRQFGSIVRCSSR